MLKQKTTSKGDTGIGDGWLRFIVPDSHGCYIDPKAEKACLDAVKLVKPNEIVLLGDHVDVSGMYSAQLQPLYQHTSPTEWCHGVGLQLVAHDGRFIHINVPIVNGWCGLEMLIKTIKPQRYRG